jgi:hypothetical protein
MTHLRTTCPRCQRLLEAPAAACLVDRSSSTVWLICRPCGDLVGRPVTGSQSEAVLGSLVDDGGHPVETTAIRHPERRPDGPALSPDDLLSLHQSLQDDGAVSAALRELTEEQRA